MRFPVLALFACLTATTPAAAQVVLPPVTAEGTLLPGAHEFIIELPFWMSASGAFSFDGAALVSVDVKTLAYADFRRAVYPDPITVTPVLVGESCFAAVGESCGSALLNVTSAGFAFNITKSAALPVIETPPSGSYRWWYTTPGVTTFRFVFDPVDSEVNYRLSYLREGVPEPGTWALLVLGFGAAGALLRRRRQAADMTAH